MSNMHSVDEVGPDQTLQGVRNNPWSSLQGDAEKQRALLIGLHLLISTCVVFTVNFSSSCCRYQLMNDTFLGADSVMAQACQSASPHR